MNKAQEWAWLMLFLAPFMVAISGGVFVWLFYLEGRLLMLAAFALWCVLLWLLPYMFSKIPTKKARAFFDERDKLIQKRATLAGYLGFWFYFVTACIIPLWFVGPTGSISAILLPIILLGGIIIFAIIQNLATLIQYGRGGGDG
jgi:hypothetical protein